MEKFYYNSSEVRGYNEKTGTYISYPTEEEYHEAYIEQNVDYVR